MGIQADGRGLELSILIKRQEELFDKLAKKK